MQDAWEQAFVLMADHGQCGACSVVVDGMRTTPPRETEQFRRWEAIADCLNAIANAQATRH